MSTGRLRMSLRRFHQLAAITTAGVCVLVVAGGVVRLTGSGLGCDDWPNCNEASFVDVSTGHAAIEQINRLLSGLIGIPTVLLAIGAFRVRPRRPELIVPALGVLVSILGNGVVGGIAVRGDLHQALVQSHFLLAMISIACGIVAFDRSRAAQPPQIGTAAPSDPTRNAVVVRLVWLVSAGTAVALVTGTVVTGTGPHAGEEDVRRFGFDISDVARIHSLTVLATVALAIVLAVRVQRDAAWRSRLGGRMSTWMFIAVLQGGIGYLQYFTGVPEVLVGAHLALATGLWVVTVLLLCDAVHSRSVSAVSTESPASAVGAISVS
jgi:cytochrome c oxidase assembly protein subunit 15